MEELKDDSEPWELEYLCPFVLLLIEARLLAEEDGMIAFRCESAFSSSGPFNKWLNPVGPDIVTPLVGQQQL